MIVSSFMLISTSGKYVFSTFMYANLDYTIFRMIIKNKPNMFFILRLFNVSSSLYFIFIMIFTKSYLHEKAASVPGKIRSILMITAFPVIYAVFYDPAVTYLFYYKSLPSASGNFYRTVCYLNDAMQILSYLYLIYPLIRIVIKSKHLYTPYKKRQMIGVVVFILLTNVLYTIVIKISSVRYRYDISSPISLIRIRTYGVSETSEYVIYSCIMFMTIAIMFYLLRHFNLLRYNGLISKYFLKKYTQETKTNMINIFHGVKNIVYSHKLVLQQAMLAEGDEKDRLLNQLNTTMSDYISSLTMLLDSNDTICDFELETAYVSDIIDDVADEFSNKTPIKIVKNYVPHIEKILCDQYHLKEAFKNIIQNSIDAINQRQPNSEGIITLSISCNDGHY